MKLRHFFFGAIAALTFSSCNLTGNSEATPLLTIGAINLTENDTLGFYADRLDSVYVGDTIQFHTQAFGQYHSLLEYHIVSSDTACVEFIWGDKHQLDSIFTSHSDGHFFLGKEVNALYFPFKYIIKQPKDKLSLTFSALTNASADYNSRTLTIYTPAKVRDTGKEETGEAANE